MNKLLQTSRNSKMNLGQIYFWTSSIKDWANLLEEDIYKMVIMDSLKNLVTRRLVTIYAFVIMPNHIHLVWKLNLMNGKESPVASFHKFTAHQMVTKLQIMKPKFLSFFEVNEKERKYRIWQRDALAIKMNSRSIVEQKINYIHTNPLQEKWNLATRPELYRWSSAQFYETGKDEFGFLTHYMEEL